MSGRGFLLVLNALCLRGLGSGVVVLFTVLVSRFLDAQEAAHFFLLFNISAIAAVCFRWGLDEVIIRRVASVPAEMRATLETYMVGISHRRVLVWTIVVFAIAFIQSRSFVSLGAYKLEMQEALVLVVASALIALVACAARAHQGSGRTNLATFLLNIIVPFISLLGLLIISAVSQSVKAYDLFLIYACVAVVVYLGVVSFRYGSPIAIYSKIRTIVHADEIKADTNAANKLGGVVLAQQILIWAALLIVPAVYGEVTYNGFVVAQKIATLISLVMLAINFTLSSRFSSLFSAGLISELRRMVKLSIAAILLSSVTVMVIVLLLRRHIFEFAKVSVDMDVTLAVLLSAQVLFSLASLFSIVLSMCRDDNFLLRAHGLINIIGALSFFLATQAFKIEVACIFFIICYFALAITLGYRVHRIASV